jgi:hypothetical protein
MPCLSNFHVVFPSSFLAVRLNTTHSQLLVRLSIPSRDEGSRILRLTNCEKRSDVHHEPVLRIPETVGKGYGFIAHLWSAACALFACSLLTRKKRPLEVEKLDMILWMFYYGLNESVIERREV